ncbi:MAG: arylsulfatase [Williamsia sp.]|nr:arylsulfatase [Williamsia sp.]
MRNLVVQTFTLFLGLCCLVKGTAQNKAGLSSQKPNIILIVADDLGWGDLGCYGQEKIRTPNLDKLATQGIRMEQFYAGTAVCAPSRASLLTGKHTGHTTVRGNRGFKPEGQFPFADSVLTLSQVLQKRGYATAAFGKWGLGYPGSTGEPLKKGFDQFYGYNCQTLAHNYYPAYLWSNHTKVELPENEKTDSIYSADLIHQQAMRFLQAGHKKPFFLFLPYTLPHGDVIVPHDSVYNNYVQQFHEPAATRPLNDNSTAHGFEPQKHAAFAAMVSRLDRFVGEVVAEINRQGLAENTLIIFTSDNGPHRENGGDPEFFNSNGGLHGIKRDLYEGGIRVPFMAVWKGHIAPSVENKQTAAYWDLMPTLEAVAGIPLTKNMDGISILPLLTGKPQQEQHPFYYWEFHESGGRQAVRAGHWKGVKLNVSTIAHPLLELYDLDKDPAEKNNVAAQHPDVVKELEGIIVREHRKDPNWPLLLGE